MKKLLSIFVMVLCALSISAQEKEVTKFLGIPVDGTKAEMRKKLIEKGFTPKTFQGNEFFEGEFNGHDVHVYIVTNSNKVWRIAVHDKNTCSETDIKIRFNNLCSQFSKNEKYAPADFKLDQTIPDDEDIAHEILVNDKRYQAEFWQVLDKSTLDAIKVPEDRIRDLLRELGHENPTEEQLNNALALGKVSIAMGLSSKKSVWFMINKNYGKFYISMYYDNKYNEANGEDL